MDLSRRVHDFFARNAPAVRSRPIAAGRSRGSLAAARGQLESQRPNWPLMQQQMEESRREYAAALRRRKATCAPPAVGRPAGRHRPRCGTRGPVPEAASEDRPQANESYRSAAETLDRVRRDIAGRAADWKRLLQQVEEAAGLLQQAEELARQDLQLAQRAAAEIDAAERELARAGTSSSWAFRPM